MSFKTIFFLIVPFLAMGQVSAQWWDDCSTYSFEAGAIYWKAYSVKQLLGSLQTQITPTSTEDEALYLQSEFDWGYRLAGGYRICNSRYYLEAEYVDYCSSSTFSITVPDTSPSIVNSIFYPFPGEAGNLNAKQKIEMQSVDFTGSRTFIPYACCSLSLFGGVRYYYFKVNVDSIGSRTSGIPAQEFIEDCRERWNVGPIFGIRAHCKIYSWLQFSVLGMLGGLAGEATVDTTTTSVESPPGQPQVINTAHNEETFDVLEPVTQVRLSWCGDWCTRCATFFSEIGYEYRSYRSGVPSPQFAGLTATVGVRF